MKVPRTLFIYLMALSLLIGGCRKQTSANWDVDAILPVLNSTLNIKNFIPDTIFRADNTGLLHLTINREVAALKLDSLVSIPDTTLPIPFKNPSPFGVSLQPGSPINIPTADLTFDFPDGVAITSMIVREGTIKVIFSNDITEPLDLIYVLPTVLKNGQPYTIKETIPPGQNSLTKSYDLSGYTFNLRGLSGQDFNVLAQNSSLSLSANANTVFVPYNQGASVILTYSHIVPEFVEGYFGQQTVDIASDTADISFLQNFKAENFMLSDATMNFKIVNEFGVDFSGSISNVKAINTKQNKIVALNSSQLSSITLDRATRVGNILTSKYRTLSFNSANSNIAAFISTLPDKLTYQGKVQMNPPPLANISNYHDFAFYNTGLRILADIDIPMQFRADYFELQTESAFSFEGNDALDGVNSGEFVVYSSNGFPFTAQVQAYMYDAQGVLIDSVFVPGKNLIERADIDAQNNVTQVHKSEMHIPVTIQKLDNLVLCKKMKIISRLMMPPNPPDIRILESYEIGIKITAAVNYNVDLGR